MKVSAHAIATVALFLSGCVSAAPPAPKPSVPWPATVADTCPEREVPLECFRRASIQAAIESLSVELGACHRPGEQPVDVMLRVETLAGAPTCVERSPREGEAVSCLAKAVARHLVIRDSRPDERCSFRFPVSLR